MGRELSSGFHVDLGGCRAMLIGLGARTNVSLARYLVKRGSIVTISDRKSADALQAEMALLSDLPISYALGGHREEDIFATDVIFVSPGVPRDLPVLVAAERRGIPISSEIELLFAECPSPITGVTGSSGKTTTISLVGDMLRVAGLRCFVGGNIGTPLIDRLDEFGPGDWLVLELSSFQLETLGSSPRVGAILNVTPNHLDRHKTMARYVDAKLNIVRHQGSGDTAVLGIDDTEASRLGPHCGGRVFAFSGRSPVDEGTCLRGAEVLLRVGGVETAVCRREEIQLMGEHNLLNVLAATAIAGAVGVAPSAMRQVATTFRGVEHRLELVRTIAGVTFYNDSIATTPERALAALRSFTRPVVLIAGGQSKHLPLDELVALALERCRAVVTIGDMAEEVESAIRAADGSEKIQVRRGGGLEQAVRIALEVAQPGDVVLLSPAGTSFDAFRDFEDRGRRFKETVGGL